MFLHTLNRRLAPSPVVRVLLEVTALVVTAGVALWAAVGTALAGVAGRAAGRAAGAAAGRAAVAAAGRVAGRVAGRAAGAAAGRAAGAAAGRAAGLATRVGTTAVLGVALVGCLPARSSWWGGCESSISSKDDAGTG